MADRVINVTVSNVNTKNVTVSSKQVANEISATADSSVYYSQLAKNWAIGEGLIQNEDYSSKTYAGVAQEAAENAQGSADTAQALVNDFSGVVDNAITEIDGVKTEALTAVTSSKDLALSDISATQSSALTEIGDLKNSSLTEISASLENATGNITDAQSNAVETVSTLGDNYISNINTTGDKYIADIGNAGENYIDNINATGKGFDNLTQRQITNCLLEVPQRIKYDLTDGVLTIKAGSVVIVPYGTTNENFTRVGSPTIVNGVMSNSSESSYLTISNNIVKQIEGKKSWRIDFKGVMPDSNAYQNITGQSAYDSGMLNIGSINGSGNFFVQIFAEDGTQKAIYVSKGVSDNYGKSFIGYASYNGNDTYTIALSVDNGTTWQTSSATWDKTVYFGENDLKVGYRLLTGNLDLKQFSITVDDKVVYRPYIQKGDRFLHDNFKVADTQFAGGKFFVWAELVGDATNSRMYDQNEIMFIDFTQNILQGEKVGRGYSGNVAPTLSEKWGLWYDTATNLVKLTLDTGATWTTHNSFPVMLATNTTEGYTSVDQVFNGMGDIGSTVWVDKGVKGLIPNGRNEDGTLKNIEWTNSSFSVFTHGTGDTSGAIIAYRVGQGGLGWFRTHTTFLQEEAPDAGTGLQRWYKPSDNIWRERNASNAWYNVQPVLLGEYTVTSGVISNFNPKEPITVADIQDVVRKTGDTMTGNLYINATSYMGVQVYNTIADATQSAPNPQENYMLFACYDKNDNTTGEMLTKHMTNGSVATCLRGCGYASGSKVVGELQVGVDVNGNAYALAPHSAVNGSIVTQAGIKKATNGYMKLGNGMILQWGVHSSGSGGDAYTITLPTAFSNTNYSVVGVSRGDKVSNSDYQVHFKITSKTQFAKTGQVATGLYWFAIGY